MSYVKHKLPARELQVNDELPVGRLGITRLVIESVSTEIDGKVVLAFSGSNKTLPIPADKILYPVFRHGKIK